MAFPVFSGMSTGCGHELENKIHVIGFPDPDAEQVWEASIKQLRVWLCSQQTYRDVMEAIIQGLENWHHPPNPTTTKDFAAEGWDD